MSSRAETAFSEGRFADAIRLYLDAWEAVPSAAILYNVAFIYDRRLSDPELATQYYERAARSSDADASLVEKARARIAAIEAEAAKKPPPPQDLPPRPPPIDPDPEPVDSDPIRLGPVIVMGSGGALLIGGLAMGLVASSTHDDFTQATTADQKRSLQSSGETQAVIADVLMITGVLAAAGGLVWYLLDDGGAADQRVDTVSGRLRLEPMLLPGGAGLSIGGSL